MQESGGLPEALFQKPKITLGKKLKLGSSGILSYWRLGMLGGHILTLKKILRHRFILLT